MGGTASSENTTLPLVGWPVAVNGTSQAESIHQALDQTHQGNPFALEKQAGQQNQPPGHVAATTSAKRKRGSDEHGTADDAPEPTTASNGNTGTACSEPGKLVLEYSQDGATVLQPRRPVKADLHWVFWCVFMELMDTDDLLRLREAVPRVFRLLDRYPATWGRNRRKLYGDALPDLPQEVEVSEFQYADLRHEYGCQKCHKKETRKTYWPFLRRWCKECFGASVVNCQMAAWSLMNVEGNNISRTRNILSTAHCLPAIYKNSRGTLTSNGQGRPGQQPCLAFCLKSDVDMLKNKYIGMKAENTHGLDDAWNEYCKSLQERTKAVQKFAIEVEKWEKEQRDKQATEMRAMRAARESFFAKRALQLDPPMTLAELRMCPSYQRSMVISKYPSSSSWEHLKNKVLEERPSGLI